MFQIEDELQDEINKLRLENKKLKSALNDISEYSHTLKSYQSIISHLKWIANKALGKI